MDYQNLPWKYVTLLTDLGTRDYYLASVKAHILVRHPLTHIIDVADSIEKNNLAEAYYNLKSILYDFPKGTIHIAPIETLTSNHKPIVIQTNDYYLLGFDDGLFSLILSDLDDYRAYEIPCKPQDLIFSLKKIFAPFACQILYGRSIQEIAVPLKVITKKTVFKTDFEDNFISGKVLYIDSVGNLITNIVKTDLEAFIPYRDIRIYCDEQQYTIRGFSQNYWEANESGMVAFFNSQNHLEISILGGSASGLLGLRFASGILVEVIK